jgi:hypothetical protein
VLTGPVLAELVRRVGVLATAHLDGTVASAIAAALQAATVTVHLDATLRTRASLLLTDVDVLGLRLQADLTGSAASFTGVAGAPPPVVQATVTQTPTGVGAILDLLGIGLDSVVNGVLGAVGSSFVGTLAPAVGARLVAPLLTTATGMAGAATSTLVAGVVPPLLAALRPVLDAFASLVRVTVNARPDEPGSVGPPGASPAGRWWQSAVHVGVVDASGGSVAELFVANAAVGPNALRH